MATLERLNDLETLRGALRKSAMDALVDAAGAWVYQTAIRRHVETELGDLIEEVIGSLSNPKQRLTILMGQVMKALRTEGYVDETGWAAGRAYRLKKRFL